MHRRLDEISLYPEMLTWLKSYLLNKHPGANVTVYDVHSVDLCDFFEDKPFRLYFPEYSTFKIRVDLIGVVEKDAQCTLTLVEVKDTEVKLINLSQLIGYAKVVLPETALLISPMGMSAPLERLLVHFNRKDIMGYDCSAADRVVRIAKWLPSRKDIDIGSVFPAI